MGLIPWEGGTGITKKMNLGKCFGNDCNLVEVNEQCALEITCTPMVYTVYCTRFTGSSGEAEMDQCAAVFFFLFFFCSNQKHVVSYIFIVLQFSSDVKDSFDVIICSHANKLTLHALIYTDCSGNCYSILLLRVWTKDNRKHKHSNHTRVLLCSFICHRTKHKHLFFFSLH